MKKAIGQKAALFIALSIADFYMTWLLFHRMPVGAAELNPVASYFLKASGWPGMALFKMTMVLVPLCLFLHIQVRHSVLVDRALSAACVMVGGVSVYGGGLLLWLDLPITPVSRELAECAAKAKTLERMQLEMDEYRSELERLHKELAGCRCTLCEAVRRLEGTRLAQNQFWLEQLARTLGTISPRQALAANLLQGALEALPSSSGASRKAESLKKEYDDLFHLM